MYGYLAIIFALFLQRAAAFWRMPCASPLVYERSDPIVTPGSLAGHMHAVMGASRFNYSATTASLKQSDCTTCQINQDKSAYWVPNIYYHSKQTGKYTSVNQVGGMTVYYIQRYGYTNEKLYAFPDGFRMLAGGPLKRSYDGSLESQAISYHCLDYNNPSLSETHGFPTVNCPNGLRQQIFFPSCWDGVNVDSIDHKSHVAYPSGSDSGTCPSTHPYRLISLFYEIIWDTNAFKDSMTNAEFVLSNGDPTGYSSHGDFLNGWDHDVLQKAVDTCTADSGVFTECPVFDIIPQNTAAQCSKAPSIVEPTFGTLNALPGNNPIQAGPGDALLVAYDATIPKNAVFQTTPLTADARVASQYPAPLSTTALGCYADGYPFSRTMPGLGPYGVFAPTALTNELCSAYCLAQGFAFSGTEYGAQCFCSNAVPPTKLAASQCNMACNGNAAQTCGGNNALSVTYNKAGASFASAIPTAATTRGSPTATTAATSTPTTPAYTTSGSCNGTPFGSNYVCWGGKQLCPIVNGVVFGACAGACFDPTLYNCANGFLQAGPATTATTRPASTTTKTPSRTFATLRTFATNTATSSRKCISPSSVSAALLPFLRTTNLLCS